MSEQTVTTSTFKLEIEQIELFHAFQQIKPAIGVGKRCLTPHDKFIYLEVKSTLTGRMLTLRATAGGDFKEISIPIKNGADGVLPLVDFNTLYSVVSTIEPTADIELYEDPSGSGNVMMNYTGRQDAILFSAVPSMNFPLVPDVANAQTKLSLTVEELEKASNLMSQYIAETASNPILACMNVKIDNGLLKVTGIDDKTKRFAYMELATASTTNGEFVVEVNKFKKVFAGFDPAYTVNIAVTPGHVSFYQANIRIALNGFAGVLPDVTPFTHKPHKVALTFNKQEMLNALDRVRVFVDETNFSSRVVSVNFDNGFTSMKIDSNTGRLSETVLTQMQGNPFKIDFLVDSLHHSIKSIDDDNIAMLFSSKSGGVLMPATQSQLYQDQRVLVQAVRTV